MVLILTTWSPTLAFQRTLKCWTLKFKWRTVHLELDDSHLTKYDLVKFKMDCIIADILKIVFGHNSASDCPISVKFCVEKQYFLKFRQWDIRYTRNQQNVRFVFLMHWASASGCFLIVSDTLSKLMITVDILRIPGYVACVSPSVTTLSVTAQNCFVYLKMCHNFRQSLYTI